jgi:hypothetical protein
VAGEITAARKTLTTEGTENFVSTCAGFSYHPGGIGVRNFFRELDDIFNPGCGTLAADRCLRFEA